MLGHTGNLAAGTFYSLFHPIILKIDSQIEVACRFKKMVIACPGRHEWRILSPLKLVKPVRQHIAEQGPDNCVPVISSHFILSEGHLYEHVKLVFCGLRVGHHSYSGSRFYRNSHVYSTLVRVVLKRRKVFLYAALHCFSINIAYDNDSHTVRRVPLFIVSDKLISGKGIQNLHLSIWIPNRETGIFHKLFKHKDMESSLWFLVHS